MEPSTTGLVDWDLAARTAVRLSRPGPRVPAAEAVAAVGLLREASEAAPGHVARVTELSVAAGPGAAVVERGAWARANVAAFRDLLDPVLARALARRAGSRRHRAVGVTRRVTGAELGSLLALLAPRVLGQYDAFGPEGGRLLLVAPNVLEVAQQLDVDLAGFSLWVALHEETHRVQFAAAPWLADHLRQRVGLLTEDLLADPGAGLDRAVEAVRALPDLVRRQASGDRSGAPALLELLQTPEQRRALAEVTAVMSLLEGHADVVMDEVGPQVVPDVGVIRERFSARRATTRGLADRLLRSALGLEAKLRQYADGARFVRGVTRQVGMAGLNAVWAGPQALPTPEEIAAPGTWVRRVHG